MQSEMQLATPEVFGSSIGVSEFQKKFPPHTGAQCVQPYKPTCSPLPSAGLPCDYTYAP